MSAAVAVAIAAQPELTAEPRVAVVRDRYVPGGAAEGAALMPLGAALSRRWWSDAHFCQYEGGKRLTQAAIGAEPIRIVMIAFDVDCAQVHGSPQPAPQAWRDELAGKVAAMAADHPGAFCYSTRGGARLVWRLAAPVAITSPEAARQWSRFYLTALRYLERRYGIVADPSCHDWSRLFRLPHALRTKGGKPEQWGTLSGHPERIGALSIEPSGADVERARELSPRVFALDSISSVLPAVAHKQQPELTTHSEQNGVSLFQRLLAARGLLGARRGDAFVITCPNDAEHSSGKPGDGSSLLYVADHHGRPYSEGAIHCKHSHCLGLSVADWRELLGAEPVAVRTATIARVFENETRNGGIRLALELRPADGGGPLPYARFSAPSSVDAKGAIAERWGALWEAAGIEPPTDLDPAGDLGGAIDELRGRTLRLEIDATRENPIRRLLPASEVAA